eukprot:CAMPEP_0173398250 /NCGR_PEP_ID=MMETSP1356-20130122/40954_1 /TAXON_ID=77927 ORGANISM="Hemiselmis virescens, Strain PCC157" /NCGR_SAMPLE_ID=MMETSP1356 /ASSEMBLY_ACC=CAM_ASM_000847 /LENGTH=48 /DNA_ID= /DNA_START= /DNA_END= /DNA_ORIENTATION=
MPGGRVRMGLRVISRMVRRSCAGTLDMSMTRLRRRPGFALTISMELAT